MQRARIAVVGAGHLGTYHAQKIKAEPRAQLVAIVDPSTERREKLTQQHEVPGLSVLAELAGRADAVIIATPTTTHGELAQQAIEMGMDVLIEKPITVTLAEGRALAKLGRERQRIVQVGHTERWNPAIAAALAVADRPGYITSERLAPFSGRSTDVDVILDLMIHDLDIVAALVKSPLVEARAIGVPVLTSAVDMAAARLQFEDGTVAQLSAGRASLEPVRKIRLFTRERYVSIDCATREVKSVRRDPPPPGSTWPTLTGEPIEVPEGDALQLQDSDFVRCVLTRDAPRVDAEAGLRALELACAVKAAMTAPIS